MNSYGRLFRVALWGESHGPSIGVTIDGCPPGVSLSAADFAADLQRRRSGATGTTPRRESDVPQFLSGLVDGKTTGSPLTVLFDNSDTRSVDYAELRRKPRPGHADWVATRKYGGFNDVRGGGHFSGRLTLALVTAGVVAKRLLPATTIRANLLEAGGSADVAVAVAAALQDLDSVGGLVECRVTGLSVGLGEPFFDSVESIISHLLFAVPAVKGVEFGSGFAAARMRGSEHNDALLDIDGTTATNHAGGIVGGLTNGNELVLRVAFKPTSSIGKSQQTIDMDTGDPVALQISGRHDACIALRAPVVVEAAVAMALADLTLQANAVNPVRDSL